MWTRPADIHNHQATACNCRISEALASTLTFVNGRLSSVSVLRYILQFLLPAKRTLLKSDQSHQQMHDYVKIVSPTANLANPTSIIQDKNDIPDSKLVTKFCCLNRNPDRDPALTGTEVRKARLSLVKLGGLLWKCPSLTNKNARHRTFTHLLL